MLDPFPFAVPTALAKVTAPIAEALDLSTLPFHVHEVLFSALGYHLICSVVSPLLSRILFSARYRALSPRTRLNWDVHVTSFVQSTLISALAIYVLAADPARRHHPQSADGIHASPHYAGQIVDSTLGLPDFRQRVWGYTPAAGLVQALGAGYFVWDLYISLRHINIFGLGLLAHAVSALWVYGAGFRPFTNHYAPIFILYELSSPFLNIHWFCDKLGLTGSRVQLYNGILLIASFFLARLVWGVYFSVTVFVDIAHALQYQDTAVGKAWLYTTRRSRIQWWLAGTYLAANLTLTALNIVWFGRMIATIRARFAPPFGTMRAAPAGKEEIVMGRSVDASGQRSVEVHSTSTSTSTSTSKSTGSSTGSATRSRRKA